MDCSMPGFPVFHYLPEFAQSHIHRVNDVIQPSHPLLPPSPFALGILDFDSSRDKDLHTSQLKDGYK